MKLFSYELVNFSVCYSKWDVDAFYLYEEGVLLFFFSLLSPSLPLFALDLPKAGGCHLSYFA